MAEESPGLELEREFDRGVQTLTAGTAQAEAARDEIAPIGGVLSQRGGRFPDQGNVHVAGEGGEHLVGALKVGVCFLQRATQALDRVSDLGETLNVGGGVALRPEAGAGLAHGGVVGEIAVEGVALNAGQLGDGAHGGAAGSDRAVQLDRGFDDAEPGLGLGLRPSLEAGP